MYIMMKLFASLAQDQQPSMSKLFMNSENTDELTDDLREEYDFSQTSDGVRGKYAKQCKTDVRLVTLDPDVAEIFPNAQLVNDALRALAKIIHPYREIT
jgi:hypothetical protein